MITYRKYYEGDVAKFMPKEQLLDANRIDQLASAGVAYTFCNNTPIAVVGANKIWEGCWQVWSTVSEAIRGHGLFFTKSCKQILAKDAVKHNVHRYHIVVDRRIQENIRWAILLGFRYESTFYKASPDKTDMLIFTMFPGE